MGLSLLHTEHPVGRMIRREIDQGYFPPRTIEFNDVFTGSLEQFEASVQERIEVFLEYKNPSLDLIYQIDHDLHQLSTMYGRTENDGWSQSLKRILPDSFAASLSHHLTGWLARHIDPLSYNPGDLHSRDMDLAFVILNNHANFAMLRTFELSKQSAQHAATDGVGPSAFVGALAIDIWGNVLFETHKKPDDSVAHAEELLIAELRQKGLLDQVLLVASSLEPCNERSLNHRQKGHIFSCSELIVNAGILAVACILMDNNPTGRGEGLRRLREAGIAIFPATDALVVLEAGVIQQHAHFRDTIPQIRRFT